jgi:hypothetical protein
MEVTAADADVGDLQQHVVRPDVRGGYLTKFD